MTNNYWYVNSSTWDYYRRHFQLTVEEAKDRWFWADWQKSYPFIKTILV